MSPAIARALISSLCLVWCGCRESPAPVAPLATPTSSEPIVAKESLAKVIVPIGQELADDSALELTAENREIIESVHGLSRSMGLEFDKCYLGLCESYTTTIVFQRPEAAYLVDAFHQGAGTTSQYSAVLYESRNADPTKSKRFLTDLAFIAATLAGMDTQKAHVTVSDPACQDAITRGLNGEDVDTQLPRGGRVVTSVIPLRIEFTN